jgi:virginiamycin A acetyltransferase
MGTFPDSARRYPLQGLGYDVNEKRTVFLKNVITKNNIIVGDYSYYDDFSNAENFENSNVLYHYSTSKEKLIIGKFCALASGTKFIMSSANHALKGFSTFPFFIFKCGWEKDFDSQSLTNKGDIVIENDVWFGYDSTIMPGITVGNGAIVAAKSVVTRDVSPYSVVGGNPAKIIKMRFDDKTISELLSIAWWDWPIGKISRNISAIAGSELDRLKDAK